MIIIRFIGGYGNQMFNYALAKELMYKGISVKADWSFFDTQGTTNDFREPIKNHIRIDLNEAKYFDKKTCQLISKLKRQRSDIWEDNYGVLSLDQICEMNNKTLIGYYQAEEMFIDVKEDIKSFFVSEFSNNLNSYSKKIAKDIINSKTPIAIHVRGGDYLNDTNSNSLGCICGSDYYRKAIKQLKVKIEESAFFVFTNDIEYANKILPNDIEYTYISNSESDGYMDIYLMSLAKNIIIANSTFSWWGAYLCQNPEKVVIAPKEWKKGSDRQRLYCNDWILV